MTHYPPEFKASTIAKMLPPQSRSVRELAQETGIPKDTLYRWRTLAVKADPTAVPSGAGERSSAQKFAVVLQTSAMDAAAVSAYCRAQGLYPQQVEAWRTACLQANTPVSDRLARAARPARGSTTDQRPDARAGRQGQGVGGDRRPAGAPKKSPRPLHGSRGRLIDLAQRRTVSTLIAKACAAGARLPPACRCLGRSLRTLRRWRRAAGITADARAAAGAARTPANRLEAATRAAILAVANRPEFAHQAPNQIVPALADRR